MKNKKPIFYCAGNQFRYKFHVLIILSILNYELDVVLIFFYYNERWNNNVSRALHLNKIVERLESLARRIAWRQGLVGARLILKINNEQRRHRSGTKSFMTTSYFPAIASQNKQVSYLAARKRPTACSKFFRRMNFWILFIASVLKSRHKYKI